MSPTDGTAMREARSDYEAFTAALHALTGKPIGG